MNTTFSVWVGGSEVNTRYLSSESAERIAEAWRSFGYDDVIVEEIESANE